MEENKIEELLYDIGNESVEVPEVLINRVKNYMEYKPLIYVIPLSFIINLLFVVGIIYYINYYKNYIDLKYIYFTINTVFAITNAIIAVILLGVGFHAYPEVK